MTGNIRVAGEQKQGLARAGQIYHDRDIRMRQLKAEGRKVLGYLDIYPVLEMLTALDLVPFGILGDIKEPISRADACLPTIVCPFLRSALDLGLKGRYDFLDGLVAAHTCEVGEKWAHIWRIYIDLPYIHYIDTPHTTHQSAREHLAVLLSDFQGTLESFTGAKLTPERLRRAIRMHNEQRALVRGLYDLRKPDPPLIAGTEVVQVLVALISLPVEEGNELLRQVIDEVKQRHDGPKKKPARLLLWGSVVDSTDLIAMIEDLEANVVMDDTFVGSRAYFSDVKLTDDPLEGLAEHYLVDIRNPRTFRETALDEANRKDYWADLESRHGYLKDYAREWNVNGVILQTLRYCDIQGYEVPGLKDYLEHIGLPCTYLEWNYSQAALSPLRTRVQAFLEVIG